MKYLLALYFIFFVSSSIFAQAPVTYITNSEFLLENKRQIISGNSTIIKAKKELIKDAEKILTSKKLYSVTKKKQLPASKSKNDYYSLNRYAWPNPNSDDGLPYIGIDGKVNPEIYDVPDSQMLGSLCSDVYRLGLAYYFTDDERYADWIAKLIKVFFFDSETKMNPNFEYAQIIKGKQNSGGATIGSLAFVQLVDGVQLIEGSRYWKASDKRQLQQWFKAYLTWFQTSKKATRDKTAKNNIGTYYTVQKATYALFIGEYNLAKNIIEQEGKRRISEQIDRDGKLSHELRRATAWEYVKYTLTAFDYLVEIGKEVEIDLFNYRNRNGGSVRKMHQWLTPYAEGRRKWDFGKKVSANQVARVLLRSSTSEYPVTNKGKNYNLTYLDILTTNRF